MDDEPQGPAIWIDYRERVLLDAFPDAQQRNLELGDIQLALDNKTQIIIERKSIADLSQSVKDNRYREQKKRLLAYRELHPHVRVAYVIEGFYHFDPEFKCKNMPNTVLSSCIINSMFRDGIFVMLTKNAQDTVQFLKCMQKKFFEAPGDYCHMLPSLMLKGHTQQEQGQGGESSYADIVASNVKSRKRDNIDEQTCFLMQLSCIPGISSKKATDIQDYLKVNSISALVEYIKAHGGAASLKDVPGIGKTLAATVTKYLLPQICSAGETLS